MRKEQGRKRREEGKEEASHQQADNTEWNAPKGDGRKGGDSLNLQVEGRRPSSLPKLIDVPPIEVRLPIAIDVPEGLLPCSLLILLLLGRPESVPARLGALEKVPLRWPASLMADADGPVVSPDELSRHKGRKGRSVDVGRVRVIGGEGESGKGRLKSWAVRGRGVESGVDRGGSSSTGPS
jgi:hypothetical protein